MLVQQEKYNWQSYSDHRLPGSSRGTKRSRANMDRLSESELPTWPRIIFSFGVLLTLVLVYNWLCGFGVAKLPAFFPLTSSFAYRLRRTRPTFRPFSSRSLLNLFPRLRRLLGWEGILYLKFVFRILASCGVAEMRCCIDYAIYFSCILGYILVY